MIKRPQLTQTIETALRRSRIVALMGPRQSGKTTLARLFVPENSPQYFDLENPDAVARLQEPMTALKALKGIVVIDEIQRRPEIFAILRVLADRRPLPARFLILGSASPAFLKYSSESLTGRVETIPVSGFDLSEVGLGKMDAHWLRGGFPRSFLARSNEDSFAWRRSFIQTIIERDLPQLGVQASGPLMRRFWTMVAHFHGQVWNAGEPARSLGLGETTVRRYLDLLSGLFLVRQLQPWFANISKRQIKSPKIYFHDTGLLHELLGIRTERDLMNHPRSGASWEGYAIEEILRALRPDEVYFWGTHGGAELDLLLIIKGRRYGIECKRADAPSFTPSMKSALNDLQLDRLIAVYPGTRRYTLAKQVMAVPLAELVKAGRSVLE